MDGLKAGTAAMVRSATVTATAATKSVKYVYRCGYTGLTFRVRADGVDSIANEPYPPGGMLRVMRNEAGQAIGGPLVLEILEWTEYPVGGNPLSAL